MRGPIILAALAGSTLALSTVDLKTSLKTPSSAAPLAKGLVGLSLETDRWNDWAGNLTHPNDFTYTLLDNLKQKTGEAPSIRIGGATQDHLIWTPAVNGVENIFPVVPAEITSTRQLFPECSSGKIGGDWYLLSSNLPAGTPFIWGVNFGAGNSSEVVAQVQAIQEAFSEPRLDSVTLQSIELGNEPDYWAGSYRPRNWSVSYYVNQYNQFVEGINDALGSNSLRFQLGAFAGLWTGTEVNGTDLFQTTLGKSLYSFSEHHYSNIADFSTRSPSTWPAIRSQLITKSNIRGNLTRYGTSAKFFHERGVKFYLGETNTMFGHGMPGVSNSAAASLWVIDYALQAATLGVDTLHFHAGVGYNYSAFQPIDHLGRNITDYDPYAKRHITPLYTGFIAVADAIGKHGDTWISEIYTDDDYLAAYSIWEGSKPARIMLINSIPWEAEMHRSRPVIDVTFSSIDVSRAKFKRLSIPSLGALAGLTWGGQSWETYSGHVNGKENFESPSRMGVIRLEASSAVLVYL